MTVVQGGVTYYLMAAFLVVDGNGTPIADTAAASVLTPTGGAVTMLQVGTLSEVSSLTTNEDGVIAAFYASSAQVAVTFTGAPAQVLTTSEVDTLAAAVGVGGYAVSLGDGSATSFIVVHGLNTTDVIVQVYRVSTGETVICPVVRTAADRVTIGFGDVAPAAGSMRALIFTVPSTTVVGS